MMPAQSEYSSSCNCVVSLLVLTIPQTSDDSLAAGFRQGCRLAIDNFFWGATSSLAIAESANGSIRSVNLGRLGGILSTPSGEEILANVRVLGAEREAAEGVSLLANGPICRGW